MSFFTLKQDILDYFIEYGYGESNKIININTFIDSFINKIQDGHQSSQLIILRQTISTITTQLIQILLKQHKIQPYQHTQHQMFRFIHPAYRNETWLYKQYIEKKLSCAKIGDICEVSRQVISKWLRKLNIPTRSLHEAHLGLKLSLEGRKKLSSSLRKYHASKKNGIK